MGTVTTLLQESRQGNQTARDRLFAHVVGDLRRIAQALITQTGAGHRGLDGTELVNIAVLRLLAREQLDARDRREFMFVLGRAMHDVLVEEARRAATIKHGGDAKHVPLDEFTVDDERFAIGRKDLEAAICDLEAVDGVAARVVHQRFFVGQTIEQVADTLGMSIHTARLHWSYARAWLADRISRDRLSG